tara:strand:- start:1372 stop:2079 length:708 start_codon:yes stop_codon:yes gene_type:complete
MSINIITPCYNETENIILNNIKSVHNQLKVKPLNHICIFDGIDRTLKLEKQFFNCKNLYFYKTKFNHSDYGDYVRRLGTKISMKNKVKSVGYLDADNTFEQDHIKTVLEKHYETGKNIIISERNFYKDSIQINISENKEFFDTNQITFFGNKIKIGLLWGRYPNQLSLIGDRIISNYIKSHHKDDIAFTKKKTVNYSYSRICKEKIDNFLRWHDVEYKKFKPSFLRKFGFDINFN